MKAIFNRLFRNSENFPSWFIGLNWLSLTLILVWPLVFFTSIFMFDAPGSDTLPNYLLFFAINGYPLLLVGIAFLSVGLYPRNRIAATLLPCIPLAVFGWLLCLLFFS